MPRIFHILSEAEPFSEFYGGALSRWAGNTLRCDTDSIVLAPMADDTWMAMHASVRVLRGLAIYKRLKIACAPLMAGVIRNRLLCAILSNSLRDLRPGDTVWIHNRPEFALALAPFIQRRKAVLVLHLQNAHLVEWPESRVRAMQVDRYVFISKFLEAQALDKFPWLTKTSVLHSGADDAIFYPRKQAEAAAQSSYLPTVLFVGRIVPDKGVHILLEAMRLLQNRGVPLQAVIVGGSGFGGSAPTAYVTSLQQSAPANVRFEPYCSGSALGDKFRSADIFCAPSTWAEPLGLVVLEAMATGLPVVATSSGGIPEMFSEGGGLLVERNSAPALAEALARLATDDGLRKQLSREAYASFQRNFTWEVVRRNYREILHSIRPTASTVTCLHPDPEHIAI
jgi:spore coat protein SA